MSCSPGEQLVTERELGRLLGDLGVDVLTGGYCGLMAAVSRGARGRRSERSTWSARRGRLQRSRHKPAAETLAVQGGTGRFLGEVFARPVFGEL